MIRSLPLACWLVLLALALPAPAAGVADNDAFFESKVRPILVARCYSCHSSEAETLRGGLRLDSKPGWEQGGDTGPAIEPGNPDASLLVQAVRYEDEALRMPPKGKLPDEEIATLVDWVRRGAPDPRVTADEPAKPPRVIDIEEGRRAWAFQPLRRGEPPAVRDADGWAITPIDRFILAKLEEKGIAPSPPVDRVRLIRRAYYDLIGLPPTPEEIDAFLDDPSPEAYDRLVDRLLSSPHYGERQARHWLDLARYAESHGFEHDYDRPTAYHYRDFVTEAYNRDLPYDTFVAWQLAGDELAPNDPLAMKATGFLAAGVHSTQITANQAEKERYDELDDILNTTGTAFLGLTLGCARCHDHKFDPIPQKDYYRLLATFTTTVRSEVDLDLDPEGYRKAKAAYDVAHEPYTAALRDFETDRLPARLEQWERDRWARAEAEVYPWLVLDLVEMKSQGGATFTKQPDGSALASGPNPDHESYTFVARVPHGDLTAFRLEAMADPSLVKGGPGRASNGNFALSDFKVAVAPASDPARKVDVALRNARATFEQPGLPVAAAIDPDGTSAWAVDPQFGRDHAAVFEAAEPVGDAGGTVVTFTLRFANNLKHSIGRPRLSVTTAGAPVDLQARSIPQGVVKVLETSRDARTAEQTALLASWYKTIDPDWQRLAQGEREHARNAPKPSVVKALISTEGLPAVRLHTQGPDFYDKTYMLRRGDPGQKVEEVEAGFLQVLMGESAGESHWKTPPPEGWRTSFRRASLAKWMTDVDQGAGALLARVAVNRIWQHHFGRGIVATPSDFGSQGERPTHPELLDYLAAELIANGWRLKPIHKRIMTSAVYRQSSHINPATAAIDVDNALHSRQNRRRLEAEPIRDAMLAAAGMLDPRVYGPGTLDESQRRRSLYFTVKRSKLIGMMTLFDAPDALVPIGVRSTTTVAPQALFLMNNPQVRAWAEGFARRVAPGQGGDPGASVQQAYRIALGRRPDAQERADALDFLARQASARRDEGQADPEAAALADFCQVLFGLNEFIFIE
jgi:hypothetical protein